MTEEELTQFEMSILSTKLSAKVDDPAAGRWVAQAERVLMNHYRELFRLARIGMRAECGTPPCRHVFMQEAAGQTAPAEPYSMFCKKCGVRQ